MNSEIKTMDKKVFKLVNYFYYIFFYLFTTNNKIKIKIKEKLEHMVLIWEIKIIILVLECVISNYNNLSINQNFKIVFNCVFC